jgi:hypothetical protein
MNTIAINNLTNRCHFLSKDTLKLALLRSYISDITLKSDGHILTLNAIPTALLLLNLIEECALAPVRSSEKSAWPIPETDEHLLISTQDGLLDLEAATKGVEWDGTQVFTMPIEPAMRLFYESLRNLILPDRTEIERVGPKIIDNPVIRHIFDYRYI